MTTWAEFEAAEPEFAARVRGLFDARRHKTIATLRADGSPRISGIETSFAEGELSFGSMAGARKGADLRRDPRFALHSATLDPIEGRAAEWPGEAKISGRAYLVEPSEPGAAGETGEAGETAAASESAGAGETAAPAVADSFRADIDEVVHTHLNEAATLLVIDWWTPERGMQRLERE